VRYGFLASVLALLAGSGIALAQPSFAGSWEQSPQPQTVDVAPSDHSDGLPMLDSPPELCSRFWVSGDYLLWWVKSGSPGQALATSGPPGSLGILGAPGTIVVVGNSPLDYGEHSGVRITLGGWVDRGGLLGFEASGFGLDSQSTRQAAASDLTGTPVLSRPVIDALNGASAISPVAFPGAYYGSVLMIASDQLWGGEVNLLGSLVRSSCISADMIIGFRYVGLEEDMAVASTSTLLGGVGGFLGTAVTAPASIGILDRFDTRNDFYGGQIGTRAEFHWGRLYGEVRGTIGLGANHQTIAIAGYTSLTTPGNLPTAVPAGLLAVGTNGIRSEVDHFTVLPEARLKVGYQITSHMGVFVGWTLLYWYDVIRPGDQTQLTVNPHYVPSSLSYNPAAGGPAQPSIPWQRTDFWATGLNVGLEFRF
jgi:hypothetical protein